jgi:hypothetical protein
MRPVRKRSENRSSTPELKGLKSPSADPITKKLINPISVDETKQSRLIIRLYVRFAPILAIPGQSESSRKRPFVPIARLLPYGDRRAAPDKVASSRRDRRWKKFEDISCRTSKVAGFSVAFCWTAGPPTGRHNFRMLISRAGRNVRLVRIRGSTRLRHKGGLPEPRIHGRLPETGDPAGAIPACSSAVKAGPK